MYRLRRLYLDAIGVPDNRFNNVTVDFTGVTGEPTDAIVWLRNGAGKTTMLSLLLVELAYKSGRKVDRYSMLKHRPFQSRVGSLEANDHLSQLLKHLLAALQANEQVTAFAEEVVRQEVALVDAGQAAGFKLRGEGDVLADPTDDFPRRLAIHDSLKVLG